jgi:hypothetical protein
VKRNERDAALIGRLFAEVGNGHLSEAYVHEGRIMIDGVQRGRHIWVNETNVIADPLIHECLHRMFPKWREAYVRRTTSYLLNRLSHEEVIQLVEIYQQRKKRRKRIFDLRKEDG